MSEQLALNIIAATVGFVAAVLLCLGNALNAPQKILLQSTPFWGFNKHLAESLTAQRAQYIVGAVLLFIAFSLQLAAALVSGERSALLPDIFGCWGILVAAALGAASLTSWVAVHLLTRYTLAQVVALNAARKPEEEKTIGSER